MPLTIHPPLQLKAKSITAVTLPCDSVLMTLFEPETTIESLEAMIGEHFGGVLLEDQWDDGTRDCHESKKLHQLLRVIVSDGKSHTIQLLFLT